MADLIVNLRHWELRICDSPMYYNCQHSSPLAEGLIEVILGLCEHVHVYLTFCGFCGLKLLIFVLSWKPDEKNVWKRGSHICDVEKSLSLWILKKWTVFSVVLALLPYLAGGRS